MAIKQITQFIDDLDGTVLEDSQGITIRFALEGRSYDIDLSDANVQRLRDTLAPFIEAARPVSASAVASRARSRTSGARSDLALIRQWAKDNGLKISERGRIAASVLDAYESARSK